MRRLATTFALLATFLVWCDARAARPPEVREVLEAVGGRVSACETKYAGAAVVVVDADKVGGESVDLREPDTIAIATLCEYIAWEPLARRWADTATKALEAEARANQLAAQLTEARHQVDRLEARGEQLSERVGQIGGRPTKLKAAAWGGGASLVALGVGVVVGLVVR